MAKKKVEKNVIQFMHPSNLVSHPKIFKGESRWFKNFDNKEILLWNYSAHNRKPMIAEGEYLCKNSVKSKELIFWGEWEECSIYENGYFIPVLATNKPKGKTNTDPFVFGDHFYYTTCQQKDKNSDLTDLEKGALILFGCHKDNSFYIDTVFVVGDILDQDEVEKKKGSFSKAFQTAVLDALVSKGAQGESKNRRNNKCKTYVGQMYSEDQDFYSFVPCVLKKQDTPEKARFKLSETLMKKFNLKPNLRQHYAVIENANAKSLWKKIVKEVKDPFSIAVKFEEPKDYELKLSSAKKDWLKKFQDSCNLKKENDSNCNAIC